MRSKTDSSTDWQQLQESGIFVEDDQQQPPAVQVGTQTSGPDAEDKFVQAVREVCDAAVQSDAEPRPAHHQATASSWCQTEEQVMSLSDFKDIELYYVEQIELLQKEKAGQRKKFQTCRDEAAQAVQQLELLRRQFHDREKQFDDILQKNCEAFERELEAAAKRNGWAGGGNEEVSALVWQEIKDYVSDDDVPKASGSSEFVQATISSLHSLCSELGQLRLKVGHLADMEAAFQTTLQQADGLVHAVEEKHLRRIRELELGQQELIQQLKRHQQQAGRPPVETYLGDNDDEDDDDDGSLQFQLQGRRPVKKSI